MRDKTAQKVSENAPFEKHTAKTFIISLILGFFLGLAVIIPGVSGSTIAIIFGLYTSMLYAIGNILNDFRRCFSFLLPIGIGAVIGFLGGFLVIQKFFEPYIFRIVCLFVGLMLGATPALTKEIKGTKLSKKRIFLFCIGFIIPIAISIFSVFLSPENADNGEAFSSVSAGMIAAFFPLGFVVSATQIIPGLSATAVLMATGQFSPILNSLHVDHILQNPILILLFGSLGIGFVFGLIFISRVFSKILEKHKVTTFFAVIGLSFGSIASMFLNTDIFEVYDVWAKTGISFSALLMGAALLCAGFALSFSLTKYELSQK